VVNLKFGPLLDTRLRVVTWNLWGRGGPFEARLDAIAATLDDVAADLGALQEVW
jgi:endonuclease/exonuclease/phosphatase family metal-dependent hydrolase